MRLGALESHAALAVNRTARTAEALPTLLANKEGRAERLVQVRFNEYPIPTNAAAKPRGAIYILLPCSEFLRNVSARAAASKTPMRACSEVHGLRGGGRYRLNAGISSAMVLAIASLVAFFKDGKAA